MRHRQARGSAHPGQGCLPVIVPPPLAAPPRRLRIRRGTRGRVHPRGLFSTAPGLPPARTPAAPARQGRRNQCRRCPPRPRCSRCSGCPGGESSPHPPTSAGCARPGGFPSRASAQDAARPPPGRSRRCRGALWHAFLRWLAATPSSLFRALQAGSAARCAGRVRAHPTAGRCRMR